MPQASDNEHFKKLQKYFDKALQAKSKEPLVEWLRGALGSLPPDLRRRVVEERPAQLEARSIRKYDEPHGRSRPLSSAVPALSPAVTEALATDASGVA